MRGRWFFTLLIVFGIALAGSAAAATAAKNPLPRYHQLEPNVAFWRDVFSKYGKRQIVFHDPYHLDLVYDVADVSDLVNGDGTDEASQRAVRSYIVSQSARIASSLRNLAFSSPKTEEERRIAAALKAVRRELPENDVLAERIRTQRGLADELCGTIERAQAWLPEMKQILAENGVPVDLASLPMVESGFRTGANSVAGAAGMWQFTRRTGRRYLRVDHVVDERRDPIAATRAAARYLRSNYEMLGAWPLAITGYNHGESGVAAAVRQLGTSDLGEIVERYRGPSFGFASRNFYAEFLAARDVMANSERHCGAASKRRRALDQVEIQAYVPLKQLASCAGVDVSTLSQLNPALQSEVVRGRAHVPRGYRLWLPAGTKASFQAAYANLPSGSRYAAQVAGAAAGGTHRVRSGQSLSEIASMYRTSVSALQKENRLRSANSLRAGQVLKVPVSTSFATSESAPRAAVAVRTGTVADADDTYVVHQVKRGETLSQIANRYDTTVASLQRANGSANVRALQVGDRVKVPRSSTGEGASYRTHKVGRGQTLSQIADLYRTTVSSLQQVNGISDPRDLRHGQVLRIPM